MIKCEDLEGLHSHWHKKMLEEVLWAIRRKRLLAGKPVNNEYFVMNLDEEESHIAMDKYFNEKDSNEWLRRED